MDKAIECYTKHLELTPNDTDAMYNIAMIHANKDNKKRDFALAEKWYQKCIETDEKFLSAYNNLGLLYANSANPNRNYVKSKTYYDKAIEIDHNFGKAHNNLGVLYHSSGFPGYDLNISRYCYETAIDVMCEYPIAHFNLANLLIYIEDKKTEPDEETCMSEKLIIKCLQNYLELVPDDNEAQKKLANIRNKMDSTLMESISYLEKYILLQPMDIKSKETLDALKNKVAIEVKMTYKEIKAEYQKILGGGEIISQVQSTGGSPNKTTDTTDQLVNLPEKKTPSLAGDDDTKDQDDLSLQVNE